MCKHEGCRCHNTKLDGYCSQSCQEGRTQNGKCACGHAECS